MGRYRFSNNGQSTLAAPIAAGATSLSVDSADSFPSAGNFTIVVDSEIMLVTGVVGTIFTVTRAQEGTSAAAHSAGVSVNHVLTAQALSDGLVYAGSSFPSDPAAGERCFRTDRGIEYYWDGSQWLSTQLHFLSIAGNPDYVGPATASINVARVPVVLDRYGMYLVDYFYSTFVATTNNASHYWDVLLQYKDGSGTSTLWNGSTYGNPPDEYVRHVQALNASLTSGADALGVYASKAGSPGGLTVSAAISFRLVG